MMYKLKQSGYQKITDERFLCAGIINPYSARSFFKGIEVQGISKTSLLDAHFNSLLGPRTLLQIIHAGEYAKYRAKSIAFESLHAYLDIRMRMIIVSRMIVNRSEVSCPFDIHPEIDFYWTLLCSEAKSIIQKSQDIIP